MSLQNYRNYKALSLDFNPGTNIFYGSNAQGKTNILEAAYVSGTTKSHRSSKDRELILFSEEEAHICTFVEKNEIVHKIDMHLRKNRTKGIAIDGIPIKKASELFGIIYFVFFSPEDLSIIKNGPSQRRRFIDMELCQLSKIYLHNLTNYNRLVLQRNKLLKELYCRTDYREVLEILDMQICNFHKPLLIFYHWKPFGPAGLLQEKAQSPGAGQSAYPSATSSIIIIRNPAITPAVPRLECSPWLASGISSSTTT